MDYLYANLIAIGTIIWIGLVISYLHQTYQAHQHARFEKKRREADLAP